MWLTLWTSSPPGCLHRRRLCKEPSRVHTEEVTDRSRGPTSVGLWGPWGADVGPNWAQRMRLTVTDCLLGSAPDRAPRSFRNTQIRPADLGVKEPCVLPCPAATAMILPITEDLVLLGTGK
jgi:hypothetical protein